MLVADDLGKLLNILPDFVREPLEIHPNSKKLIEVVMDLGRRPEARFPYGPEYLSNHLISWHDLDFCIKNIGNFSGDNRSGIEYTLHRISSIKNRQGSIIGLTCRVGRAIFGTISVIRDLLETGQSILLLGKPGVGKTTAIREIARILADEMEKRVVIIDTSNEIAGDGDIPHPAIGRARRMQVARPELQHQVMIEAVENHMPEVIIIDEIGTELEAVAARTIAERGVQLVGTAHGHYLASLIKNPTLSDLIGGIQYVTLGDDEAKRRGSQKSILERKSSPAFEIAIEMHDRDNWIVHEQVAQIVDQMLKGSVEFLQRRTFNNNYSVHINCEDSSLADFMVYTNKTHNVRVNKRHTVLINNNIIPNINPRKNFVPVTSLNQSLDNNIVNSINYIVHEKQESQADSLILYTYGISLKILEAALNTLKISVYITRDIMEADLVLGLRSSIKHNNRIRQLAKAKHITIYTIHSSTVTNITRALKQMLNL